MIQRNDACIDSRFQPTFHLVDQRTNAPVVEGVRKTQATKPALLDQLLERCTTAPAEGSLPREGHYPDLNSSELLQAVLTANWKPFEHPAVFDTCLAFQAAIPGHRGVVDISQLPRDTPLRIERRKDSTTVTLVAEGHKGDITDFSVVVLGADRADGEYSLRSIHPGAPARPTVAELSEQSGDYIRAETALAQGFTLARPELAPSSIAEAA